MRKLVTKSGMIAGMGETPDEVRQVMKDLRSVHCDILTIGRYLRPSRSHHPVREYVTPERFARYRETALETGFRDAVSSPFARSSYMAEESFRHASGA